MVGLVATDGGAIHIDSREITHLAMHKRARLGLSYLPQEASVFRKLTVEENVRAVLELQYLTTEEITSRQDALLADLNISHLRNSAALSLSGGERRRVEIARALATSSRGEIDQARAIDANPAALPAAPLSKSISGVKSVKCTALVIVKTPLPGLADADAKSQLTQSLTGVGLTCAEQSPVEMMLLVSISEDQPRRALGVMLLVTRVMKLPGEAFSKQAAVWGQQRTSLVNDASAATQLNALIQELVAAMNLDLAPPVATPPVSKPPVLTPPIAKPPVATPPVSTPPVATPPVSTPPVSTPPVSTPPVSPPANGKP